MFKADGQIPGRIFILWSTVWDPHTKEGEHGQSRISTEESRHRLELVGELQKIRAKATMTLLYPLIISIERFTQWIASPIQPNRSSHEGTPNKYRIPFFHILLSTKEWVFFFRPPFVYTLESTVTRSSHHIGQFNNLSLSRPGFRDLQHHWWRDYTDVIPELLSIIEFLIF